VGVAAGFMLARQDEAWLTSLIPSGLAGGRGPASTRADLYDNELFAPWHGAVESFGVFANFLFSHNSLVGIMTFGLGLAAGIPTLMLNVYQGLTLGAFLALHYSRDLTVDFLGWILDPRNDRARRPDSARRGWLGDRRKNPVPGPLFQNRKTLRSMAAKPPRWRSAPC